jgi:hypothetical protein
MEINEPKISFEYVNSFGDVESMSANLEDDTIFSLVQKFKAFLLSAGFHPNNIEDLFVDGFFTPEDFTEVNFNNVK